MDNPEIPQNDTRPQRSRGRGGRGHASRYIRRSQSPRKIYFAKPREKWSKHGYDSCRTEKSRVHYFRGDSIATRSATMSVAELSTRSFLEASYQKQPKSPLHSLEGTSRLINTLLSLYVPPPWRGPRKGLTLGFRSAGLGLLQREGSSKLPRL